MSTWPKHLSFGSLTKELKMKESLKLFLSILVIYYIIEYIAFDLNESTLWLYVLYLINMSEYILISQL